jgi:broad specificity phosphatase PhoE
MGKMRIILLRHTERLDRQMESQGLDWIHQAEFPQDSPLSPFGIQQARKIGQKLKEYQPSLIRVSPMIRTIMTADIISREFSIPIPLVVEEGLIEEAKSMRGKDETEPPPVWINGHLHQSKYFLKENYSDLIDLSSESLVDVNHAPDTVSPNKIREVHDSLVHANEIIQDRCQKLVSLLKEKYFNDLENGDQCILCVGHGASCKGCANALQSGLPQEMKIEGSRTVGAWAVFIPLDDDDLGGPWYCPERVWSHIEEDTDETSHEILADQGNL